MIAQSIRYWLADLITGGALTRAKADNAMWFEASAQLGAKFLLAGEAHADEVDRLTAALRTIAAMETPSPRWKHHRPMPQSSAWLRSHWRR